MIYYNKLRRPPTTALKTIAGGRLKGKSDINPQWRFEVMTETFGPCGIGWRYEITRQWIEMGTDNRVFCFTNIHLFIYTGTGWSYPIPGTGGSMLIEKESGGLYNSDEAYKMSLTDALSVAFKALGVAADIYAGAWDGSKYIRPAVVSAPVFMTSERVRLLETLLSTSTIGDQESLRASFPTLSQERFDKAITYLNNNQHEHTT